MQQQRRAREREIEEESSSKVSGARAFFLGPENILCARARPYFKRWPAEIELAKLVYASTYASEPEAKK